MSIKDIFKIKEYKSKIKKLTTCNKTLLNKQEEIIITNTKLQKEKFKLNDQISELQNNINTLNTQLNKLHNTIENSNNERKKLKNKNNDLQIVLNKLKKSNTKLEKDAILRLSVQQKNALELADLINIRQLEVTNLAKKYKELSTKIKNIKSDICYFSTDLESSSWGLYKNQYSFETSLEYKKKLLDVRAKQEEWIKQKTVVYFGRSKKLTEKTARRTEEFKIFSRSILRSFNTECTYAIDKVTANNFNTVLNRIERSFRQHNNMYKLLRIRINEEYLALKLDELHLAFEYAQKKQEEKLKIQESKKREREEKRVAREIKKKQEKINKEIMHYDKVILELQAKNPDDSNKLLLNEISQLKNKLENYKEQKKQITHREQNTSAGYVYIISNIGSFGENIFKIGVTRRLEPLERINELGNASVPFKFDVHALLFSEDAYKLENELHNYFSDYRVNLINKRKEYFHLSITQIIDKLNDYTNTLIDFQEFPTAEEYHKSLALKDKFIVN